MVAEKMLHFRVALMDDYTFKDFTENEGGVIRHDAPY